MDSIDFLKVIMTLTASEVANFYLLNIFPDRSEEQIEIDSRNRILVLLIRTAILIYSINDKWPLSLSVCINITITILAIFLRIITDEGIVDDNESDEDKGENLDFSCK